MDTRDAPLPAMAQAGRPRGPWPPELHRSGATTAKGSSRSWPRAFRYPPPRPVHTPALASPPIQPTEDVYILGCTPHTIWQAERISCPFCGTVNGLPEQGSNATISALAAAMSSVTDSSATAQERQEQLMRRLQAREITPLELLILREFVDHLQHNRTGATERDIERTTASWVVEDPNKLPEELRCCTVCLEDVERGQQVRTLPCLHTFHAGCAEEWLKKKKLCPLCQFSIDGDSSDSAVAALEAASVAP